MGEANIYNYMHVLCPRCRGAVQRLHAQLLEEAYEKYLDEEDERHMKYLEGMEELKD